MASLNYWNLLDQAIKEYQNYYSEPYKKYVIDQLKPTLQLLLRHLNYGEYSIPYELEKLSLKECIQELKKGLGINISSHYSIKKLIEYYINDDNEALKSENKFFRLDFREDLTEDLKQRDLLENKPFQESYTHLYNFLQHRLIPDFKNNCFNGYSIDMRMDYQTEYVVRHYLENSNKENYLKAIEYAVNIL